MFPKYFAVAVLFLSLFFNPVFAAQAIDINTADVATIAENLNGIGESKARAIVAYRAEHGKFADAQELIKVKGIGAKLVERNRDLILFGKSAAVAKPKTVDKKSELAKSSTTASETDKQPQLSN